MQHPSPEETAEELLSELSGMGDRYDSSDGDHNRRLLADALRKAYADGAAAAATEDH